MHCVRDRKPGTSSRDGIRKAVEGQVIQGFQGQQDCLLPSPMENSFRIGRFLDVTLSAVFFTVINTILVYSLYLGLTWSADPVQGSSPASSMRRSRDPGLAWTTKLSHHGRGEKS